MDGDKSMAKWQIALVLACIWLGGCRVGISGLLKEITGPSRGELVSDAFSGGKNPDEQREAINKMIGRYWGLNRAPLSLYALRAEDDTADPTVRSEALRGLGLAGEDAAEFVDSIAKALANGPDNVRWDAAVVLDRIVSPKAIIPLRMAAMHDESVDVRIAAVTALRHYRTTGVAKTLVTAMREYPDYSGRKRAHASLVEIAGRDLGPTAQHWGPLTKHMPDLPAPKAPWWDLLRMTVKSPKPAPAPESKPAEQKQPKQDPPT